MRPGTCSRSRSTASARSRRPRCCAPSATSATRRSPALFGGVDDNPEHPYIAATLDKDPTNTQAEALIEVYKKLRPGDPPTGDNARQLVESLFFNFRRYDLGRVGRYKFNKKLDPVAARMGIELPREDGENPQLGRTITREDIAAIVGQLDRAQQRRRPAGRHRPPRQPAHPRQRRADPERLPDRPPAHGARRPRADDDPGDREGDAERPHQHPAGRGGDEGVLRRQPALPVHGPDQPAGRADQQAPPLGPRPGRPLARARRLRRPRRPPQPLRPHLPDRDAGRPEHRPDRLAGDVRPDQRVRLHRDALPQGQADRRLGRPGPRRRTTAGADLVAQGRRGRRPARASRSPAAAAAELKKQKAQAFPIRPVVTDEIVYLAADEEEEHYVAQANARARRAGPLRRPSASRAATATSSPRSRPTGSSTWTSAPSRSSRSRRRSSRSSSTTTPTAP